MKRNAPLSTAAAALAAALLLTSCGSDAGAGSLDAAAGASASREDTTLVVYSNSTSDGRGEWLVDRAAAAGFTVEYVDMGGADAQNRLIAEKDNPVADVVFGPGDVQFLKLSQAGALGSYEPEWAAEVAGDVADGADGSFWPIVREPIMLVHNTAALSDADAPQDWPDLWEDPAFHGRYETPTNLGGGTTRMVIAGILSRYLDPNGRLGVSDAGWDAVEQFFANGNPAIEGTDLYARMAAGEVDMGQMWLAGKVSREKQYSLTTEAAHPAVGVPMVHQNIGLVAGGSHEQVAQEFIDWFGGAETQAAWSQQFFTVPTNAAALAGASTEAVEMTDSFTPQDIDWSVVAEQLDAWVEEIELNYLAQ